MKAYLKKHKLLIGAIIGSLVIVVLFLTIFPPAWLRNNMS